MSKKTLLDQMEKSLPETDIYTGDDCKNNNDLCDLRQIFDQQYWANLNIKDAMFQELAEMKIPENVIRKILNLEDEPPF